MFAAVALEGPFVAKKCESATYIFVLSWREKKPVHMLCPVLCHGHAWLLKSLCGTRKIGHVNRGGHGYIAARSLSRICCTCNNDEPIPTARLTRFSDMWEPKPLSSPI